MPSELQILATSNHLHLRVVHVPQQEALLRVQDEVAAQEAAAALIFFNVQEATDAILAVHVRHHKPRAASLGLGVITGTQHGGGGGTGGLGEVQALVTN